MFPGRYFRPYPKTCLTRLRPQQDVGWVDHAQIGVIQTDALHFTIKGSSSEVVDVGAIYSSAHLFVLVDFRKVALKDDSFVVFSSWHTARLK